MTVTSPNISPVFIASTRRNFACGMENKIFKRLQNVRYTIATSPGTRFVKGYCLPCNEKVSFVLDGRRSKGQKNERLALNWREGLICPGCMMSSRQRLMAAVVKHQLQGRAGQRVYLMEKMTSFYRYLAGHLKGHTIIGSEYFGKKFKSGSIVKAWQYITPIHPYLFRWIRNQMKLTYHIFRMGGIRHEDATQLSFASGSLDLIVSNDVFEHVPDPYRAFTECARVLRSGGVLLATFPFHNRLENSIKRARQGSRGAVYQRPPVFHGNPISSSGALVFTDFGWDVIHSFQAAGFSRAFIEVYASENFGHLDNGLSIFRVTR